MICGHAVTRSDHSTTVSFTITLNPEGKKAIKNDGIEKTFKLASSFATTNMVCFDLNGKLRKYTSPEEILEEFYDERLMYYGKRKVRGRRWSCACSPVLINAQAHLVNECVAHAHPSNLTSPHARTGSASSSSASRTRPGSSR
jgi:hypothetical protein